MIRNTAYASIVIIATLILAGCASTLSLNSVTGMGAAEMTGEVQLPEDAVLTLDTLNSKLHWEALRLTGKGHTGSVTVKEGSLLREGGEFVSGNFVIDMTTISEDKNNERFLGHIRSEDFFDVETYPTSGLLLRSIKQQAGNSYLVTADLTILDQTHQIMFPAKATMKEGQLRVISVFEIDRTRWGIIYDSGSFFQQLGDKAIKDEVKFGLELLFNVE